MDLFPLGLILVEILHPDFQSVFDDEEDARMRLSGRTKPLIPESALSELRESFRGIVGALLDENPDKRRSAAQVIKAPVFSMGMQTQMQAISVTIKAGQAEVLEAISEV